MSPSRCLQMQAKRRYIQQLQEEKEHTAPASPVPIHARRRLDFEEEEEAYPHPRPLPPATARPAPTAAPAQEDDDTMLLDSVLEMFGGDSNNPAATPLRSGGKFTAAQSLQALQLQEDSNRFNSPAGPLFSPAWTPGAQGLAEFNMGVTGVPGAGPAVRKQLHFSHSQAADNVHVHTGQAHAHQHFKPN